MESTASIISQLKSTQLLKHCDDATLEVVSASCERIQLKKGEFLFRQDDQADALFIVVDGFLRITVEQPDIGEVQIAQVGAGKLIGEMHTLNAGRRTATVAAQQDVELLRLSAAVFQEVVEGSPPLELQLKKIIHQRFRENALSVVLTKIFGQKDGLALHHFLGHMAWHDLKKGAYLFHEGDSGNSLFFVVSGLLQVTKRGSTENRSILGELKRGDCLGEMAMLSGNPRSASIHALRDSELAELPKQMFDQIVNRKPGILKTVTNTAIDRLGRSSNLNWKDRPAMNIAVIQISPNVRFNHCLKRLLAELSVFGATMHWNSERVDALTKTPRISQTPIGGLQHSQLTQWLDELEIKNRFNIFETDKFEVDKRVSPWTIRCLERADRIYLLANSADDPALSEIETALSATGAGERVERTLILLHRNGDRLPVGTDEWLSPRKIKLHHHIRINCNDDFKRLARFAAGRTIGLVLGGGGARGFAHMGVIRALMAAGVPVDIVGGTSIGALIAAQPAMGWDYQTMLKKNRECFVEAKPLSDYTIPMTSIIGGRKLDACLKKGFQDLKIEDLWLNYFSLSSDLTSARLNVHRRGELWEAVRASLSIPGIVPPVIKGKSLLVDGGILNNLPGDVMKELYGGFVIAVDVSRDTNLSVDYRGIPSPSRLLWSKIWPFANALEAPGTLDILISSTLLNSINKRNEVKSKVADLYLQPPVSEFKMLDFVPIDTIAETGYHYAKNQIDGRIARGLRNWAQA